MKTKAEELRAQWMASGLARSGLESDPVRQFEIWYGQAIDSGIPEPNGFSLATVVLYLPLPPDMWSPLPFVAGVLVFTPLLFDTAYTLFRRYRAGKNIFSAHREHIYQRITPSPTMHRRTSNLYYGASAVAGFAALMVAAGDTASVAAGMVLALAVCAGLLALPSLARLGEDRNRR